MALIPYRFEVREAVENRAGGKTSRWSNLALNQGLVGRGGWMASPPPTSTPAEHQYGRGGVNRIPPEPQQGVNNHWQRSHRVNLGRPQSCGLGPLVSSKAVLGPAQSFPRGCQWAPTAVLQGNVTTIMSWRVQGVPSPSHVLINIRIDAVRPKARVGSHFGTKGSADGMIRIILQVVCPGQS
ncbi:TPA: hypothetical protein ACH3X3_000446 [Trebouxia sp. C0006]